MGLTAEADTTQPAVTARTPRVASVVVLLEPGITTNRRLVHDLSEHTPLLLAYGDKRPERQAWAQAFACDDPILFDYRDGVEAIIGKMRDESARRKHLSVDGLLTLTPMTVAIANQLQHALGLPTIATSPRAALRDKAWVRRQVAKDGTVLQPNWLVLSEAELPDTRKLGFPLVVKPAELSGSLAVKRVEDADELREFLPHCSSADFPGEDLRSKYGDLSRRVLVETWVHGRDYSIECAVRDGVAHVLGAAHKVISIESGFVKTLEHSFAPKLEVIPERARPSVLALVDAVHRAAGIVNSFTDVDIKINDAGVWFIELNARIAGGGVLALMQRRFESWLPEQLVRVARGQSLLPPAPPRTRTNGETAAPPEAPTRAGHEVAPPYVDQTTGRTIAVRVAREEDAVTLGKIERRSWEPTQAAATATILARIVANPNSTLLALDVDSGQVLGLSTHVLFESLDLTDHARWTWFASHALVPRRSSFEPQVAHGLSLTVDPAAPRGVGTLLKKAAIAHYARLGVRTVFSAVRIPGFAAARAQGVTIEQYYQSVVEGRRHESAYGACAAANGSPQRLLPKYYDDPSSHDFAILLKHPVDRSDG